MPSVNGYLVEAIVRADFMEHVSWGDRLPSPVKRAALAPFPQAEPPEVLTETFVSFKGGGPRGAHTTHQEQRQVTQWVFHNAEQTAHLRLATNFVLLVYDRLKDYKSIERQFEPVWTEIVEKSPDLQVRRLGLRLIYHVPRRDEADDARDWTGIINEDIAHILRAPDPRKRMARAVGVVEYNLEDCLLRFQFGMHNPDFPALLRQTFFLLDFDCYVESLVEPTDVMSKLALFSREIGRLRTSSMASRRGKATAAPLGER